MSPIFVFTVTAGLLATLICGYLAFIGTRGCLWCARFAGWLASALFVVAAGSGIFGLIVG